MNPLSKEVRDKISDLVKQGVCNVSEMRRHLRIYVESVLFRDKKIPPSSDAAFFPTDATIRMHIYRAMLRIR
jgi:hypothetical protein